MASNHNISQLLNLAFGITASRIYNVSTAVQQGNDIAVNVPKESQQRSPIIYKDMKVAAKPTAARLSDLGLPMVTPLKIIGKGYQVLDAFGKLKTKRYADFEFPAVTLITLKHAKTIIKTPTLGNSGTVKELFGYDDWSIVIQGLCLDDSGRIAQKTAQEQQTALMGFNNIADSVRVVSDLFNLAGINDMVIRDMNTPISYYGGKQNLIKELLPLFPEHNLYVEPFVGGGAVFRAKRTSQAECINDTNKRLINFYECVKSDFIALEKMVQITEQLAVRMQNVDVECTDALRIIRSRDCKHAFLYCNPPYFNSDCGHYDGYSKDDFEMLLKTLSRVEGKFLLSSYPSDLLTEYTKEHKWASKQSAWLMVRAMESRLKRKQKW